MKQFHYLFHVITYYLAWFVCLTLASRGYAWVSTGIVIASVLLQLYWQYRIQHHSRGIWTLLTIIVIMSTVIDSLLVFTGIIIFNANPFAPYFTAPWMISIWISFTVILYATLDQLFDQLVLLALLSFFGFAAAFMVGAKMGAAVFPYGYQTCWLIGAIWLILLPALAYSYRTIIGSK